MTQKTPLSENQKRQIVSDYVNFWMPQHHIAVMYQIDVKRVSKILADYDVDVPAIAMKMRGAKISEANRRRYAV